MVDGLRRKQEIVKAGRAEVQGRDAESVKRSLEGGLEGKQSKAKNNPRRWSDDGYSLFYFTFSSLFLFSSFSFL